MDESEKCSPGGLVDPTVRSLRPSVSEGLGRKRLCASSPSAWVTRAAAAPTSALRSRSQSRRRLASASSAPTIAAPFASAKGAVVARAGEGVMRVRRAPAAISDPAKVKGPNPVVRQLMDGPRGPRLWEQEACRPRTAAILLWLKGGPQRPGNGDRKSKAVPKGTFSRGAAGRMIGRRTRDSIRSLPAAGGHGAGTIPASTYSTQVPRQWTG